VAVGRGAIKAAAPFAALLLLGVGFGGAFTLAKIATTAGASPLGLAFWGGLGAGLVVLAAMIAGRKPLPLDYHRFRFYLISGLFGVAVPEVVIYTCARMLPVGVLTLVVTMAPVVTYALALPGAVERLAGGRILGLVFSGLAVLLLVLPETSLPAPGLRLWVLIACVGPVGYAMQNVMVARWGPAVGDSLALSCGSLIAGGLLLLPFVIAGNAWVSLLPPWGPIEWAAIGIILVNAAGTVLFFALVRRTGPLFASQASYVMTVAGFLWGFALFGERPSIWIWAALVLMLIGISLVGRRGKVLPV